MQRNCTEFIAYEDITGAANRGGRHSERGGRAAARRTSPQRHAPAPPRAEAAGRPRGAAATRAAQEHAAAARFDVLRERLRRQFVPRLRPEAGEGRLRHAEGHRPQLPRGTARGRRSGRRRRVTLAGRQRPRRTPPAEARAGGLAPPGRPRPAASRGRRRTARPPTVEHADGHGADRDEADAPDASRRRRRARRRLGPVEGLRILQAAFTRPGIPPRFPMYVRQVKQFVRQVDENFDERKYGFTRHGGRPALRAAGRPVPARSRSPGRGPRLSRACAIRSPPGRGPCRRGRESGGRGRRRLPRPIAGEPFQPVHRRRATQSGPQTPSAGRRATREVESVTYDVVTHVTPTAASSTCARTIPRLPLEPGEERRRVRRTAPARQQRTRPPARTDGNGRRAGGAGRAAGRAGGRAWPRGGPATTPVAAPGRRRRAADPGPVDVQSRNRVNPSALVDSARPVALVEFMEHASVPGLAPGPATDAEIGATPRSGPER